MIDQEAIRARIVTLEIECRDLEKMIQALAGDLALPSSLSLARLKKRQQQVQEDINRLKMQLVPDIPA